MSTDDLESEGKSSALSRGVGSLVLSMEPNGDRTMRLSFAVQFGIVGYRHRHLGYAASRNPANDLQVFAVDVGGDLERFEREFAAWLATLAGTGACKCGFRFVWPGGRLSMDNGRPGQWDTIRVKIEQDAGTVQLEPKVYLRHFLEFAARSEMAFRQMFGPTPEAQKAWDFLEERLESMKGLESDG